jgi:hypothetical protein
VTNESSTKEASIDSLQCGVGISLFSSRTDNHVMAQTLVVVVVMMMMMI